MYVTIQTVKHNGKLYPPKSEISLPAADAGRLLKLGAIERQKVDVEARISRGPGAVKQTPPPPPPPPDTDARTHTLNVAQALELVAGVQNVEELERLWIGEQAHPEYEGGRSTVIKAIEARAQDLGAGSGE